MLVDRDVSLEDAEVTLRNVVAELQRLKIIVDDLTDDCVLSGLGYRPGTAIDEVYKTGVTESPFWNLRTCGVEPTVKRHFNYWAYGPSFDGVTCPNCKTHFQNLPDHFPDGIAQWLDQLGPAIVECTECNIGTAVDLWDAKNPFGFGNLSLIFWNWPPFNRPGWKIDIPEILQTVTGHAIVSSYGHI